MSAPSAPDDGDGISRRTLVRLLVALAVGIPLLVEGMTFLGLVGEELGDGDAAGTATPTAAPEGVGIGDELLPRTVPTETVVDAYVAGPSWTFTMVVTVENGGDRRYELRLGRVTTDAGEAVEGGGDTGTIPPGESASVTARWDLPEGATPAAVDVEAVASDGTTETVSERVQLGRIPVRE